MNLTAEQQAILDFAKSSKQSLLIEALAGAAKTTQLTLLANQLPPAPTLCVAFNKKIAEEMKKRMPGNVECATLNSVGHRAWMRVTGKRLIIDTKKNYNFVGDEIKQLTGRDKDLAFEHMSMLMRCVALAKTAGYVPPKSRQLGKTLVDTHEDLLEVLDPHLDELPTEIELCLIDRVLDLEINASYKGVIDFDDQIYMSTLFNAAFIHYYVVMVDEAQDLSPLNHEMLPKMLQPNGRLIAVGDPWQSIYAFRGAAHGAMDFLRGRFQMETMRLSMTFRVPKAGVERARSRVPHMQWWPDHPHEGSIHHYDEGWSVSDVPENSAIICRNNAPLFACALQLIKSGRGVRIVGADIGPALVKTLRKLGDSRATRAEVMELIDAWTEGQLKKTKESRHPVVYDKAECLKVFAEAAQTLGEAVAWAENLFSQAGTIQLMTGHKSKGLEFDVVFHLDPWRVPSSYAKKAADAGDDRALQQELNLKYVIETRFKRELHLVNLKDFQ